MEGKRKCAWLNMNLSIAGEPMEGVTDIYTLERKEGTKTGSCKGRTEGDMCLMLQGHGEENECKRWKRRLAWEI